ncbi:MAG: glucan 1,4-alpha-glucosidase [Mucilaginibacter sp.]|nr:glucan 1,4-alpha-glucosidase [Mucilaginibacter sp.]
MKKIVISLISLLLFITVQAQNKQEIHAVMNKIRLDFMLDANGRPNYKVFFEEKPVINKSYLGIRLANESSFDDNFEITGSEDTMIDESWQPVWGEVKNIRNHYRQIVIHLKQKDAKSRLMNIIFRVFEDGVGFRYEFPKQPGLNYFTVADELTEFSLTGDHKTFWIPGDYDSNEYQYTISPISKVDASVLAKSATDIAVRVVPDKYAIQTPLMMKTADGLYINIHEAALSNYTSMQLHVDTKTLKLTANLVPDAVGNKAYMQAPCSTPWRTIIVSNKAADILSSKMILNLNEPSKIENTSWIKPMKFVGIWLEMQTGKSTWNYADRADVLGADGQLIPNGKHGANTANVKRYIDFAAKN